LLFLLFPPLEQTKRIGIRIEPLAIAVLCYTDDGTGRTIRLLTAREMLAPGACEEDAATGG
jgi:hypothetical protein